MKLENYIALELGLPPKAVARVIKTAPKRYKVFPILKRNGKPRWIAQPALELKAIQRVLITRFFSQLPVHDSAYAYVRGRGIRQNAYRHAKSSFILKLDFKDFFHSIRPLDLERVLLNADIGLDRSDFENIYQLAFWGQKSHNPVCLSIGAPSSPMLSNVVMYDFDKFASELAMDLEVVYTRYADDLTISSSSSYKLLEFERRLPRVIEQSRLNLSLNDEKRGLYGRGERRMVTGLIVTPNGSISIGRERKRQIRSLVDHFTKGTLSDRDIMKCKGLLAFVIAAEPSFLRSLMRSYSQDTIRAILRLPIIRFWDGEVSS